MTRAHFVKKARKDNKDLGIKKGESYYWWKFRFGGKHASKTPPKRSELTQSAFYASIWDIEDTMAALTMESDFESEIENTVSELENVKDECQNSLDNMPEQLQSAPTGELLQNRMESIDEMIDELQGIGTDIDEDLKGDDLEKRKEEVLEEIRAVSYNGE